MKEPVGQPDGGAGDEGLREGAQGGLARGGHDPGHARVIPRAEQVRKRDWVWRQPRELTFFR
jgi:hypothetical protein